LKIAKRFRWFLALAATLWVLPAAADKLTLFVIADTGDCATAGASLVSSAIRKQPDWKEGWLVEVGDLAYPRGTREYLARCHEPYFGMFEKRLAVPGNHDWSDRGAAGFYALFPDPVPRVVPLAGRWQLWLLDSELRGEPWRAQIRWLDQQARQSNGACVIAAWHRPRWSSGWHGDEKDVAPLWERTAGVATFTLHGHDHHYEEIAPLNKAGKPDPRGTRSFVVGNGGASLYPPVSRAPERKAVAGQWGFLRIDLDDDRYTWTEFAAGGETLDSGSGDCRPVSSGSRR
jgi:acid phosphatase type 7